MERLRELDTAYGALPFQHTYWRELQRTIPLDHFRDQFYLGQQTTRETYDYVRSIDSGGWLAKLGEDGAFGARPSVFDDRLISRDLLDSVLELRFARETIGRGLERATILDVGAGYGRLAYRIASLWPEAFVYCADAIAVSTRVCELYLSHRRVERAAVVPFHELRRLPHVDVAFNVHSWSECTLEAIEFWLGVIGARNARHLMIVPNAGAAWGEIRSEDGHNYWPSLERRGWRCLKHGQKYPPLVVGFEPTPYFMFEQVGP